MEIQRRICSLTIAHQLMVHFLLDDHSFFYCLLETLHGTHYDLSQLFINILNIFVFNCYVQI